MTYAVVTSFSPEGYDLYGKRFVETFLEHWPEDVILHVHHEGHGPEASDRVRTHDLRLDPDRTRFLDLASTVAKPRPDFYRYEAAKFCHKVFAFTSHGIETDWLIWIDADVVTTARVDEEWLDAVCPGGYTASYLGREGWDHSELGWCALSKRYRGEEFLKAYRAAYTSTAVFSMDQWHDSYVWDRIRERFEAKGCWFYNLSQGVTHNHVWPHTLLGQKMDHRKGPVAKQRAYGGIA